jgi:hypothetical protein
MENSNNTNSLIDGGVVIVIITVILYVTQHSYAIETAKIYKIPSNFFEPGISDLVHFAETALVIALIGGILSFLLFSIIKFFYKWPNQLILFFLGTNLMNVLYLVTSDRKDYVWMGCIFFLITFNPMFFLLAGVRTPGDSNNKKSYVLMETLFSKAPIAKYLRLILIWGIGFMLSIGLSVISAGFSAKTTDEYYVTSDNAQLIVFKFGEVFVGKPYSGKTGIISDSVIIIPPDKGLILKKINQPF